MYFLFDHVKNVFLPVDDKTGPRARANAPKLLRIPITVPFCAAEPRGKGENTTGQIRYTYQIRNIIIQLKVCLP